MSAHHSAYRWTVGDFTAELVAPAVKGRANLQPRIVWTPAPPPTLTPEQAAEYRTGRDAALEQFRRDFGDAP